jgi:hypothetical protein
LLSASPCGVFFCFIAEEVFRLTSKNVCRLSVIIFFEKKKGGERAFFFF